MGRPLYFYNMKRRHTMKTSVNLVNEDKLYSVIGKFFTDGSNLLLELIQNSQRAKARKVSVNLPWMGEHPFGDSVSPQHLLRIEDDGRGIRDITALLGIAISDWNADISSQDPAGMGFLQLLALSKQVHIQSRFGSLHIESQRFLKDGAYRQETLEAIDKAGAITSGTVITAEMLKYWVSYLRSDMNWYRGHNGIELVINGELIEPISINTLIKEAEEKKNLYNVLKYRDNTLFIEIGPAKAVVGSGHSAVNWYGQLIPMYLSSGASSNYHIRFYYEVTKGTPLTPRYPDRTSINVDDRHSDFMGYVNRCTLSILRRYFDSFPTGAKFSASTNASLLSTYYEHAAESELAGLDLVPVTDDAFSTGIYVSETITSMKRMKEEGACFHEGDIEVDESYRLGADWDEFRCYSVSEKVAEVLRAYRIPELQSVSTVKMPEKLINVSDLMLELRYTDGRISVVPVSNAILMDSYREAYIYAESEALVQGIMTDLLDRVYVPDCECSLEDLQEDLSLRIDEQLAASFSIIDPKRFDFIPRHHDIKQISFEYGNLAVAYQDGSNRNFAIRR